MKIEKIEKWVPSINDFVIMKLDRVMSSITVYRIIKKYHDENRTVEIVEVKDSEIETTLRNLYSIPVLSHVAEEIYIKVNEIIINKVPDYDWSYEDTENIVITFEKYLRPAGKTYMKLMGIE
jgi:hypothetical protein